MTVENNNAIEKKVNKIRSTAAKNVFRVGLATSLLLGSSACVPTEAISIIPTGETNPLPSDSTKTPTLSPTNAPIELTPTVVNPATQELTLVSETEVATEMPTIALTPEPTPTATEKTLVEGNIFFDPQSETDFDKVVESFSPIDEPEKFIVWQNEYLEQIDKKLETYKGESLDGKMIGIDYVKSGLVFNSKEWPVISSYKFYWKGKIILTKTYILRDVLGKLIPLSLTYTTSDSIMLDTMRYRTPSESKPLTLSVFFAWNDKAKKYIGDEFADSFLSDELENSYYDSMIKVFSGKGVIEDYYYFSRIRFLHQGFNSY